MTGDGWFDKVYDYRRSSDVWLRRREDESWDTFKARVNTARGCLTLAQQTADIEVVLDSLREAACAIRGDSPGL